MATEAGHIQITEFKKEVIPILNYMLEDLFCQYGVHMPYFLLDFDFPDYSQRPDWVSGYNFNLDWGEWGYNLPWFNELLGFIFDEAHLPRWEMPDFSFGSWNFFNEYISILYDNIQTHYVYGQSGTFTKDEVVEGETSGITGYYKWKDSDGYIHIANKQDSTGGSVSDFEDEKVVGADSGAYFYTYEDYWSLEKIYCSPYDAYNTGLTAIYKRGESAVSIEDSWDKYDAYSVNEGPSSNIPYWGTSYNPPVDPVWRSWGMEGGLSFDTTDAPLDASAITLNIDIDELVDTFGTPQLKIYSLDHAFGTSDWLTGGVFVTSENLTETGLHSYPLEYSDINAGGITWFRFSLAVIEAQTKPDEAAAQRVSWNTPVDDYTYLEFTK